MAEVPFADDAGRVAARLQQLGERDLVGGRPSVPLSRITFGARPPATPYMPLRIGSRPVSSAARLGEHTGWT